MTGKDSGWLVYTLEDRRSQNPIEQSSMKAEAAEFTTRSPASIPPGTQLGAQYISGEGMSIVE